MANKKDHIVALEEDLPPWMPRENKISTLLEAAAEGSVTLEDEIEQVKEGLTLQEANTEAEIEQIAAPLQITSDSGESVSNFRKRTLSKFNKITTSGSPEDIVDISSSLLNVPSSEIKLEELDGKPKFKITAPWDAINTEFGSREDVLDILLDATASTYSVEIFGQGSLEYITKTEWQNDNYDSSNGYATLDADDNITDGGTYSGYYAGN